MWQYESLIKKKKYQKYCTSVWQLLWQRCLRGEREMPTVVKVPVGSNRSAGPGSAR